MIFRSRQWRSGGIMLAVLLMHGCGGAEVKPAAPRDVSTIPDAVPKSEPRSRYGNPDSYEVFGKRYYVMDDGSNYVERGIASWYGTKFHGRRTSSGETYDMYAMTAAHKTLPLPTYVRVTNLDNDRSVVVKVNDRGPFHDNRIIDLSYVAASKLGMLAKGTALVEVRSLEPGQPEPRYVAAASQPRPLPVKPVDKAATGKQFYIQVGAFASLANAERLRVRLDNIENKHARISQTVVGNDTLYRVRIGPLADIETADRIVARLPDYGINEHHIIVD